ncbi:MAG: hypothetical protein ACYCVU_00050 [Gammaproteobacteria bacterium]
MNGKIEDMTYRDLEAVAEREGLKKWKDIVAGVAQAVGNWKTFATRGQIPVLGSKGLPEITSSTCPRLALAREMCKALHSKCLLARLES